MPKIGAALWPPQKSTAVVPPAVTLAALPTPVLVVDGGDIVRSANPAAEQFFDAGAALLEGTPLDELLPRDCPLFALIAQARNSGARVFEYGLTLDTPRIGSRPVSISAAPLPELPAHVALSFFELSLARKMDHQLSHRHAARSVSAMAMMLAHEVKNPLSGIRGAAQLLEETVGESDREFTRLICEETDRIVALLDRMDVFSDALPLERTAVNIHEVLERVRRLAQTGFARNVKLVEHYDPSLPPVFGNRDRLVQIFLNLVKNAAEAVPNEGGEILLSTAYQHGVRLAVPGNSTRMHLPLVISVQDNGPGIPEDIQPHLFDPFVTTKPTGSGLGLALVAKLVGDHGGVIEFDSQPRKTVFRILLPMFNGKAST